MLFQLMKMTGFKTSKSSINELETTNTQLRQISYQLYPTWLNKMALDKVLRAFCTSFTETTGMRIDFSSQEDIPTISNAYATAIYRMIQEGLVNAVKHANATSAWVNLDVLEDEISVSFEDNGSGFEVLRPVLVWVWYVFRNVSCS